MTLSFLSGKFEVRLIWGRFPKVNEKADLLFCMLYDLKNKAYVGLCYDLHCFL